MPPCADEHLIADGRQPIRGWRTRFAQAAAPGDRHAWFWRPSRRADAVHAAVGGVPPRP